MFAVFEDDNNLWVKLHFTYDRDTVDALKLLIPSVYRRWYPEERFWLISRRYVATIADMLESRGYEIEDHSTAASTHESTQVMITPDQILLSLFMQVPDQLEHKLYRQLSTVFHPDVRGDESWMKALNTVWDKRGTK